MRRSRLVLGVACWIGIGFAGACERGSSELARLREDLRACDYGAACASAMKAVQALPPPAASSAEGVEARRLAIRVALLALAAFPPLKPGSFEPPPATRLLEEAQALQEPDAAAVAEMLARPTCEALRAVRRVEESQGPWADVARTARAQVLAQVLASVTPEQAHEHGEAARALIGCSMSEGASPAALLVEMRNELYDLADRCAAVSASDPIVRASCEAIRTLQARQALALPWPEFGSGGLPYVLPPQSLRGTGVRTTPRFLFLLSAGRFGVVDQPSLAPGIRATPDLRIEWLADLRDRHRPEDLVPVIEHALKGRELRVMNEVPVAFFAVDRATVAADLFEVLTALTAASDAVAAVALEDRTHAVSLFFPLNFLIPNRMLLDPLGDARAFGGGALRVVLSPFRADLRFAEQTAAVAISGRTSRDLRDLYRAARTLLSDRAAPARIEVADTVPFALLTAVVEALSFVVPDAAMRDAGSFDQTMPARRQDSRPVPLCPVIVVSPIQSAQ